MTYAVLRRAGRRLLLFPLVCVLVLGVVAPASAHATLVGTDPAEGAVLDTAPERVTFTFDESVIGVPAGIKVFDATGEEVASSATVREAELLVDLEEEVAEGTLVVLWRLVSADGHPIGGSLSFSVGAPSDVVDVPASSADRDTEAPWVLSVLRWLGYVGLLVAAGVAIFAVLFLPGTREADASRRRLRTAVRLAGGMATVGWLGVVPLVALYQLGLPASSLRDVSAWAALAPAEYVVPAAVVGGLALAAVALPGASVDRTRSGLVLGGCALALAAPAFTGHTRAASPAVLVVGVDVLHLLAGAVWLGGLLAMALVLPDLTARDDAGATTLGRFSTWASGVLAVLLVTGTFNAWRIAGSWGVLLDTGYGGLLLVKVLAVLAAVGVACWNRFALLPRLRAAARHRERRDAAGVLVRTTLVEAGVLVAVLLVTGFLVDRSPEPAAAVGGPPGDSGAVEESLRLDDISALVTLDPADVGPATVTIEMTDEAGQPAEGHEAPRLSLSTTDVDLGVVALTNLGPGIYSGDLVIPTAGRWEVQVSLRTTEFDNPVRTVVLDVR